MKHLVCLKLARDQPVAVGSTGDRRRCADEHGFGWRPINEDEVEWWIDPREIRSIAHATTTAVTPRRGNDGKTEFYEEVFHRCIVRAADGVDRYVVGKVADVIKQLATADFDVEPP